LLGEGSFAQVYLGQHLHLGTQAAIKLLTTLRSLDDLERFRQEARTIAHLNHPHILPVLDFGVAGRLPYLVLPYAA
jgi:serine/threonine protein kinase